MKATLNNIEIILRQITLESYTKCTFSSRKKTRTRKSSVKCLKFNGF